MNCKHRFYQAVVSWHRTTKQQMSTLVSCANYGEMAAAVGSGKIPIKPPPSWPGISLIGEFPPKATCRCDLKVSGDNPDQPALPSSRSVTEPETNPHF